MPAVISRSEAKNIGLLHYFTGKPCSFGKLAPRFVASGNCLCIEHKKNDSARKKQYKIDNKEIISEYERQRYAGKKEIISARHALYRAENKTVISERRRARSECEKERIASQKREYNEKNKEWLSEKARQRYAQNKEEILEKNRQNRSANKDKYRPGKRMRCAKRRASKVKAIPTWHGEFDRFVELEAHDLSIKRLAATGIDWNMDHMIPLQSDMASGLHCAYNFQVIPKLMNIRKNNRLILTEPGEWIMEL